MNRTVPLEPILERLRVSLAEGFSFVVLSPQEASAILKAASPQDRIAAPTVIRRCGKCPLPSGPAPLSIELVDQMSDPFRGLALKLEPGRLESPAPAPGSTWRSAVRRAVGQAIVGSALAYGALILTATLWLATRP